MRPTRAAVVFFRQIKIDEHPFEAISYLWASDDDVV